MKTQMEELRDLTEKLKDLKYTRKTLQHAFLWNTGKYLLIRHERLLNISNDFLALSKEIRLCDKQRRQLKRTMS